MPTWITDAPSNLSITTDSTSAWSSWVIGTNAEMTSTDWSNWTYQTTTSATRQYRVQFDPPDEETRLRWAQDAMAARVESDRLASEQKRDRVVARRKARRLLMTVLGSERWREWVRYRSVRVEASGGSMIEVGAEPHKLYIIDADGHPVKKLCVIAPMDYCDEDRMIALLLALQVDEAGTLKLGNPNTFEAGEKERVVARQAHSASRPRIVDRRHAA
mgnify:CR=1 FL=1